MRTTVQKLRDELDAADVTQGQVAVVLGLGRTELSMALSGRTGRTVDPEFAKRFRDALVAITAARQGASVVETAK